MKYITLSDMARSIRANLHRIPHDVDFVMGVPRSGMIPATIIAEFLNVPLTDVDSFVSGAKPTGGDRLRYHIDSGREKKIILVVDDTIFRGSSNRRTRKKLEPLKDKYEFIYLAVYQEGPCQDVDLFIEDVRGYTDNFRNIVLYEWNLLQHHGDVMSHFIFDMDGVFCLDPPDERNLAAYQEYIRNAVPLFLPKAEIGEIVTYRLSANREVTQKWLADHGVKYRTLTMFPAQTWDERYRSGISPAQFKSDIYGQRTWAKLYIESEDTQARAIHMMTGKPVYCVSTNRMYS